MNKITKAQAEEIIAKDATKARRYLETRLHRANRHAQKVLMRTTGEDLRVAIYELDRSLDDETPPKAGINWSACGTQDTATTAAFAQALAEIAKIAEDYNTEREELLEELDQQAKTWREMATDDKEAEEA